MSLSIREEVLGQETSRHGLESLLRWRWFPEAFQVFLAFAMVVLAYLSLQPVRRAETNPATGIVWLLWWPLLPFTVPFLGRLWCALCPAGAVGDWAQRLIPQARPIVSFVVQKAGLWVALIGIVVTGLAFLAFALETNGLLTVLFLALITIGAVVLALPYRGRVWCRWFCPLGVMLGLYSRVAVLSVAPGFEGPRAATVSAHHCPQFTTPVSSRRRQDCILCGLCLKQGGSGAVVVQFNRWPRIGWRGPSLTLVEALAVSLLLGLLIVDSLRMTPLYLTYMTWALPFFDNYRLALSAGGLALIGLILGAQTLFATATAKAGDRHRLFRELSLALVPLALALHLALSAQHLFGSGPGALQGIAVELGLVPSAHMPPADAYFVSVPMKAFQFALLALGVVGMAYLSVQRKMPLGSGPQLMAWSAPALALGFIFQQPMSAAC